MNYSVVIPVLNQLHYTRQCVDSLLAAGVPVESVLVINNGSVDETLAYLAANPQIPSINNDVNLGCGGAWTQGALAVRSEWVVLLNNDVVLGHNAIEASIHAAERLKLGVVSTALIEGELDYDLAEFTNKFVAEMKDVVRPGWFHGVCFAVHRDVFHQIGFLDTDRNLFGPLQARQHCRGNHRSSRHASLWLDHPKRNEARARGKRVRRPPLCLSAIRDELVGPAKEQD